MKKRSGRIFALIVCLIALSVCMFGATPAQSGWEEPPDLILRPAAAFSVPAGVPNQIRRFNLPSDQSKDRWIRAYEFKPGDARVVRSAFFYVEKTGQWLGGWTPGEKIFEYPQTVAAYLPAGSKVVVEIQYQSIDSDVQDSSSLALFFTDQKPLRPLTAVGIESPVAVPVSPDSFQLQKEFTIISDSYALGLRAEMNEFGRSFEVVAVEPSGSSQVLVAVKDYKHDVQNDYTFEQPVFIARGTRIVASADFRNESTQLADDFFKLTMNLFSSDEYRPTSYDAPARTKSTRAVKRAPPPRRTPAKKRPVQKRSGL